MVPVFRDFLKGQRLNEEERANTSAQVQGQPSAGREPTETKPEASNSQQAPQQPIQQPSEQKKEKGPRESLADKIKPQFEAAKSIIDGIHTAFSDSCGNTTKYNVMSEQIKNFEKQIRGACEQVISMVEQSKFNWKDWNICSPKSYDCITKYKDRDFDVLKLSAAVIIFYNSLIGKN